ncbi:MAG: SspB family protein [Ahrensia sp.]
MSEDIIRYDILVQNALRGVIQKALKEVQKTGLPGNHHFFITFVTTAPGVRVSNRIREQYPEQMTIVLQHQYWDLEVTDHGFSVGLSFSDVPETLNIPYSAVRGFYDPSVNFELEFDVSSAEDDVAPADAEVHTLGATDSKTAPEKADEQSNSAKKKTSVGLPAPADDDNSGDGADVVSLDSFRNKK